MLVVDRLADIKLLFSQKHSLILDLVIENEMSISEISKSLGMNPGSVYYYLKELEEHKLARQVREEIKGGIVKKYYRSTAKQIAIQRPAFGSRKGAVALQMQGNVEEMLKAIDYFGYHLPADKVIDGTELLLKYDHRMKDMLIELQNSGVEVTGISDLDTDSVFHLILGLRAKRDPELDRLYSEFEKLFLRYE